MTKFKVYYTKVRENVIEAEKGDDAVEICKERLNWQPEDGGVFEVIGAGANNQQ